MNLIGNFREGAEGRSARVAIIAGDGQRVSYGDLINDSARLAAAWRRKGVGSGDRVLLALPLGPLLYISLAALWRLGATVVLPEPALGLNGVRQAVAATRPRFLLAAGPYRALRYAIPGLWTATTLSPRDAASDLWDNVEPVDDGAPALMSFTSGSTGRPKAMQRTHGFLRRQNACVQSILRPADDRQVDLVAFPVFVLANLELGSTSVLPGWRLGSAVPDQGDVARSLSGHGVTRALVPPAICEILTLMPGTNLNTVFTGGGPVFPDLIERLAATLPGADLIAVYGSTEAEPIAHWHAADASAADWAAMRNGRGLLAGPPVPEIRVRIVDDEILVTGDHVSKGYLDPAQNPTTKIEIDGETWHRTGDAGRLDDAGRLWLLGRIDGRSGGFFPFTVEAAARFWPDVAAVALSERSEQAVLAVAGNSRSLSEWRRRAAAIGNVQVVHVQAIPLDRRHRSKVDYPALRRLVAKAG